MINQIAVSTVTLVVVFCYVAEVLLYFFLIAEWYLLLDTRSDIQDNSRAVTVLCIAVSSTKIWFLPWRPLLPRWSLIRYFGFCWCSCITKSRLIFMSICFVYIHWIYAEVNLASNMIVAMFSNCYYCVFFSFFFVIMCYEANYMYCALKFKKCHTIGFSIFAIAAWTRWCVELWPLAGLWPVYLQIQPERQLINKPKCRPNSCIQSHPLCRINYQLHVQGWQWDGDS